MAPAGPKPMRSKKRSAAAMPAIASSSKLKPSSATYAVRSHTPDHLLVRPDARPDACRPEGTPTRAVSSGREGESGAHPREHRAERVRPGGGHAEPAPAPGSFEPAVLEHRVQQRATEGTCQMRSPDGRVEAGPGERAPPGRQRVDVDPELGKTASGGTERVPVTGRNEPGTVQERVEDGDAHVAGQVVVTGPREAEARRVVVGLQRVDRNAWTHPPEGLERFGDLGAREPVATVAPVRGDGDEAPVDERPEMAARGRRRDPGAARELRGTGLPPVEEDPEHRRARRAR